MQDQEQILLDKYTLKIKNQKMESEYQLLENKQQRKTLFPIILLYQLGFFVNYITKIMNGITLLGLFVDASTNLSLFILIICMKVKRFKKYSHISCYAMQVIMYVATIVNYIHDFSQKKDENDENKDQAFNGFYLGATLFGIIVGPSLSYRMSLMIMYTSIYSVFVIYIPANQRPLTVFIILSHLVLYVYKIYFEEKQKRQFFISTKKISFWESIIQSVLLINLIVVKYDKESQRLVLENSNNTAKTNLKVKTDEDLQFFLEQTQIKTRGEKSQEDSFSTMFDQAASGSKLSKKQTEKKLRGMTTSKSTIAETLKRKNIRGNSNSSNITLKELVKEKLHQKQIHSKNKGSAFGISDQNIQNLNGQFQNNKTGDVISFNLKVICFGMIEDYALICVEDETYKEKFSNQYLKNNFLISVLGEVVDFQKQEINSIHQQLDEGVHQLQSYYKKLQNIYQQSTLKNNLIQSKCNLTEQMNISQKFYQNNSPMNQELKTQISNNDIYETNKNAPLISPQFKSLKHFQNQTENLSFYSKNPQTNKNKDNIESNQSLTIVGFDINDDKQILNKNTQNDDFMSQFELKNNYSKMPLLQNIPEDETQIIPNQQEANNLESDLFNNFQASFLGFTSLDTKKDFQQSQLEQPFKEIEDANQTISNTEIYFFKIQKILKERINQTLKCRQSFLKLYSQVSKMKIKILNLENYLKGEKKIFCTYNQIFLDQMVYNILGLYRFDIESKKIRVVYKNQTSLKFIHQDSELLQNILQNLIQNAIENNQKVNGKIQINVEDLVSLSSDKTQGQIKFTIINSVDLIDKQQVDNLNTKFQGQHNSIYFGMERDSIQISQIRYDRYLFGLRISQKNVRCIGPLNKIDIQFTQNQCTTSFIIYQDIEILNFKK